MEPCGNPETAWEEAEADRLARRAYICAWFSYLTPVFFPLAIYYGARAANAGDASRRRGLWRRLGLLLLITVPYWYLLVALLLDLLP